MRDKIAVFIYPITSETYRVGGNSYIKNLVSHLSTPFKIVNRRTKIGLLDLLVKLPKCNVIYFNWIEDIPERRFGVVQVLLLTVILKLAKVLRVRIIWFIHNNISHSRRHEHLKKYIIGMMRRNADVILSHATELNLDIPKEKFHSFDHPIDAYQPLASDRPYEYDVLIWGTVSPYKGITEFIDYTSSASNLNKLRILIAGKFHSDAYFKEVSSKKPANIFIQNKILSEQELVELFAQSKYVLFTYNSPSVLSSAALCKTLSFGKETIGPNIGSFKELGRRGLLYTYQSFSCLEKLIADLKDQTIKPIDQDLLASYIESVSWNKFAGFLTDVIEKSFEKNK